MELLRDSLVWVIRVEDRIVQRLLKEFLKLGFLSLGLGMTLVMLFGTRRYMVYILPGLGAIWCLYVLAVRYFQRESAERIKYERVWMGIGGALTLLLGAVVLKNIPSSYLEYLQSDWSIAGIATMVLSPKPWGLSYEYGFLYVSSILHWIFLGWTVLGMWLLVKKADVGQWLVIYAVGVLVIFGMTPEVLGPRHRFQIEFVFIVAQFVLLMTLISKKKSSLGLSAVCRL